MSDEMYAKLAQAVIDGEPEDAEQLAKDALAQGLDPLECVNNGLTKGIQKVGDLFAKGEYFLPELIIGAEAMKLALAVLEPAMVGDQSREVVGRVVLGTVEDVSREADDALVGAGRNRLILSTGCVVPIIAPHGNLLAAREAPESFRATGRSKDRPA